MKQLLFCIVFVPLFSLAQGDQTVINVPISATATEKAILHLPDDYATTTTNYPIMLFLHGTGEGGTNPASIYNSSTAGGPAYSIAQGKFPSSFVNPADGKSYKFIVVSPQANNGWSTYAAQLEYVLSYLFKIYRADPTRLYLTGLSAGGEGILEYVSKLDGNSVKVNATHPVAAFIPMSAVMNANNSILAADTIIADKVHIWGFGCPQDTHGANTLTLVGWYVNNIVKKWGDSTAYAGGHCCWGQFYDPGYKKNGKSIYEWALQYTTAPAPPPLVSVPHARLTIDSTVINYPNTVLHVNADSSFATNGTIKSYQWFQVSGPNAAIFTSLPGSGMVISGTVPGIYGVKLYVADAAGNIDTAKISFQVNGPVIPAPRNVTALQISLNGIMIPVPLVGTKITYSDGNP